MLCRMKGLMFGLAASLLLSGCITLSDVATGAGAAGGATIASAAGLGPAGVAVLTVTGATAGAVAIEDKVQTVTADVLKEVTNPWQAMALAFSQLLAHSFEIVIAIGIAAFGVPMLLTFALGKVMPNRKTKDMEQENKVLKKMMEK